MSMLFETHSYWGNGKPFSTLQFLQGMYSHAGPLAAADPETRVEFLNMLAASLMSQQDTSTAEAVAIRATNESRALPTDHKMALRARMMRNWVRLYRGQFGTLRNELDKLMADMEASRTTLPEDLAGTLRMQSAVACEIGDPEVARAFAAQALAIAERRLGNQHNQSVLALVDLSHAELASHHDQIALDTASHAYQRGIEAYHGSTTHPNVVKARVAHAQALAALGRRDEAFRELRRALDDSSALFGPGSRAAGYDLLRLARLELQNGRPRQALEAVEQSRSFLDDDLDPNEVGFAGLLELRGTILLVSHRRTQALRDLEDADRLFGRVLGADHPRTLRVTRLLASCRR
jgi:tetratricopeptide (TPR) repeat protein